MHRFKKPKRFDRNLIVIGAGAAGLVAAYVAASARAKVTLIERNHMGGDCLNTGCVPSKALIRSARFIAEANNAPALGVPHATVDIDFACLMERVQRVINTIAPHDSVERYTALGVECLQGHATVRSPWSVEINGQVLTTRAIVLATGARPFIPELPGLDKGVCLTSENLWQLKVQPRRFLVLGGGPIGCELAQCFARLGSEVTIVEMANQLLPREDATIAQRLQARFDQEGITLRLGHRAVAIETRDGQTTLVTEYGDSHHSIEFDALLIALGRKPNVAGFGLETLGIADHPGMIDTNAYMQTLHPNIYACGDVASPYQFTHTAGHQAWYAAVNALLGGWWRFNAKSVSYPWTTFTDPEIARIGLNEPEARQQGIEYEVTEYDIADLDRAICDEAAEGVIKILTKPGCDKILGATIMAAHAGEMITLIVFAMRHGLGLNKILTTVFPYPTWMEANKLMAGSWKRKRLPQRLLRLLEYIHRWRRHD